MIAMGNVVYDFFEFANVRRAGTCNVFVYLFAINFLHRMEKSRSKYCRGPVWLVCEILIKITELRLISYPIKIF